MNPRLFACAVTLLGALLLAGGCHRHIHRTRRSAHVVAVPHTVAIGTTGAYYADGYSEVFFFNGYWYWCDGPYWYYSSRWGSTWIYVEAPPIVFLSIPPGHRYHYIRHRHPGHPRYAEHRNRHYPKRKKARGTRGWTEVNTPTYRMSNPGSTNRASPGGPGSGVVKTSGKRLPRPPAGPGRGAPSPTRTKPIPKGDLKPGLRQPGRPVVTQPGKGVVPAKPGVGPVRAGPVRPGVAPPGKGTVQKGPVKGPARGLPSKGKSKGKSKPKSKDKPEKKKKK